MQKINLLALNIVRVPRIKIQMQNKDEHNNVFWKLDDIFKGELYLKSK